jgi:hypothetical protein
VDYQSAKESIHTPNNLIDLERVILGKEKLGIVIINMV